MKRKKGRLASMGDLPEQLRPGGWRHFIPRDLGESDTWARYLALREQKAAAKQWCASQGVDYYKDYLPLVRPEWYGLSRRGSLLRVREEAEVFRGGSGE